MDISEILARINENILNPLILLLFFGAFIVFFWGLINFISKAESEEARTVGKSHMLWGIIGITIMVCAYAILGMITGTFGISMPF
ncbi:MAG: hypothetical protein ACQEP6_01160 [Patescibacteria group bacterium]